MRRTLGVLVILALVLVSSSLIAQPGECEPAGVFRGSNGEVLDCIPDLGTDCLACTFIVK